MAYFKLSAPTPEAFQSAAQALGFWSGSIISQGALPDATCVYTMTEPTQYHWASATETETDQFGNAHPKSVTDGLWWSGLRIDGINPFATGALAIPPGLTVYALITPTDGSPPFWSCDMGQTRAAGYVADIGNMM